MEWTLLKQKIIASKNRAVEFTHNNWKEILAVLAGIALVFSLSEQGDEPEDPIDFYDERVDLFESADIAKVEQPVTQSSRSYNWAEDGHQVRGHMRHYADGKEIKVRPYIKVTGAKSKVGN